MTASHRPPRDVPPRDVSVPHIELGALTVVMAIAPTVYTRNRMFSFFAAPEVRRARARAAQLRGIVRQLSGASGEVVAPRLVRRSGKGASLTYRVARLHLDRTVELTELETACLVYLAARAKVAGFGPSAEDRAALDAALRRLAAGLDLEAFEGA
jgi:hypothetical protein